MAAKPNLSDLDIKTAKDEIIKDDTRSIPASPANPHLSRGCSCQPSLARRPSRGNHHSSAAAVAAVTVASAASALVVLAAVGAGPDLGRTFAKAP